MMPSSSSVNLDAEALRRCVAVTPKLKVDMEGWKLNL
jgi:hypothetical protein